MTEAALFELLSLECLIDSDGNVHYHNAQGEFHRIYGPAVIYPEGHRAWYKDGQRHRPDGPAVEWTNGYRAWYQNGQRHRTGGPAARFPDGSLKYYLHGNEYPETSYWRIMALKNIYP